MAKARNAAKKAAAKLQAPHGGPKAPDAPPFGGPPVARPTAAPKAGRGRKAAAAAPGPVIAPLPGTVHKPTAVDLKNFDDGSYRQLSNGELFQLKVVKDDQLGRTHKLKNNEHFWEGSEAEFRQNFEKE